MKRIANILTIFVAAFVFIFFYQNVSSNHYNSVVGFESSFSRTTGKDTVIIEYQFFDDDGNNVFYKLIDFLEEFNYDALSIVHTRRYDFILDTNIYLHTDINLNDLEFFETINRKDIDFTQNDNRFYSSYIDEEGATDTIDFVNSAYQKDYQPKLTINQFENLVEYNTERGIAYIYLYGSDYDDLARDIENSEISNYIVTDGGFSSYELAEPVALSIGAINILLILSISSLIVISICDLLKDKKEITIRKIFGEEDTSIYRNLIAKRYLLNLILYIGTQILLYAVIIRGVRQIHLFLLKPLILAFGTYLMFWIIANLISYFVLKRVGRVTNLKQSDTVRFINSTTLIIKLVLIILMITPFINLFTTAPLIIEENLILRENKDTMNNNLSIEDVYIEDFSYSESGPKPVNLTLEFFQELNWVYHDFFANFLPPEMMEQISEEVFQEQFVHHPYIVANDAYLKNYDIRDLDGNQIDFNDLENNTLLVPQTYKNDTFTDVYYDSPTHNTVYIQDGGTFYGYYPLVPSIEVLRQHNPVILFKNQLDASMRWNGNFLSIKDEGDTREKIDIFLQNNNLNTIVAITNNDNIYDITLSRSNDQILNFALTLGLYILMVFIFQYQIVYVYFSESKEEIAVNYLFGKTYLQRYGLLILKSIVIYIAPLIIGMVVLRIQYKYMLLYISFGLVLDLIVSTIMIRSFEKKRTLSVLKGE